MVTASQQDAFHGEGKTPGGAPFPTNARPAISGTGDRPACTGATRRCEFWTWGAAAMRPACCTTHLATLLAFTSDLLTRHAIFHWLDYGSLLGAVRDGRFIPWDSDVDFGCLARDTNRVLALHREVVDAGYFMSADHSCIRIHLSKVNLLHVDLYPWWQDGGRLQLYWENVDYQFFPPAYLAKLEPVQLEGGLYPAPAPVHDFLVGHRYGPDYLIPQRQDEWRHPGQPTAVQAHRRKAQASVHFPENLRRLHDALATTALAERYWVWRELLHAWMQEDLHAGHGPPNAEFGLLTTDDAVFHQSVPALIAAGFVPHSVFVNSQERAVHYVLRKDGSLFHFYLFDRRQDAALYWLHLPVVSVAGASLEFIGRLPMTGWATMERVERRWRAPAAPESWQTAPSGNPQHGAPASVRLPQDRSIVQRQFWRGDGSPEQMLPPGTPDFQHRGAR